MEENEKQFIKAFNNGYLLRQHEPELLDKLLASKDAASNSYIKAMALGKEQYDQDKGLDTNKPGKDRYPSWLKGDRGIKDQTGPDKTKDRDIEPDR